VTSARRHGGLLAAREQGRKLGTAEYRPERVVQAQVRIAGREGSRATAAVDAGASAPVLGRSDMAGLQSWALMRRILNAQPTPQTSANSPAASLEWRVL
jgi:hypothetical protein